MKPNEWRYGGAKQRGNMAHGITFVKLERGGPNVRAEASYGARKLLLDGRASLCLAIDQTQYGDELIAQLYTRNLGRVGPRRAEGYNRVQIYLGPADLDTATALENMAAAIRSRRAVKP